MADEVTLEQLIQARQAGAPVVDVRETDEYAAGHVSGALSVPLGDLAARKAELPTDQTVYLICQGGGRSAKAADLLSADGYDVRSVAGGTTAWTEAGGQVTVGPDPG